VTESTTEVVITKLSVNDSATVTEAVSFVIPQGGSIQVGDDISTVEVVSLSVQVSRSVQDSSTVNENVALAVSAVVNVNDASIVSDAVTVTIQTFVAVNDVATATENIQLV